MNKKIKGYLKFSKSMAIVGNAFYWVSLVTLVLSLFAGIILYLLPSSNSFFKPENHSSFHLTLDNTIMFDLSTNNLSNNEIKPVMVSIMFMVNVICLILIPIFRQLTLILRSTKEGKPFAPENSRRLAIIGFSLIIGSIIIKTSEAIVAWQMVNNFKLNNLNVNFGIDINMFLVGFLVIILAGIFNYGCYLQSEYDTTV